MGGAQASTGFEAGAAQADITPPAWTPASDAAFTPACGPTPAQVEQTWPGQRQFQFEKPYVDLYGAGQYRYGDPYCDADHTGRYEAPYIAGGSGANHWPLSVESGNPISADAVVFSLGKTRIAAVSVDSIGLFNVTMDAIRARARQLAPDVQQVLISSTHDESAPDPIGLWGPDGSAAPGNPPTPSAVTSGVDEYYMTFLVERVAQAVLTADQAQRPALLKLATAHMPRNTMACWSSYPYIEDHLLPVMQAVDASSGTGIFTLVNVGTHAESLAFSGVPAYTSKLSGDWPGPLRRELVSHFGGVGMEMAGLVGSVEMPTVYEPESTTVVNVPGVHHDSPGNPDGCSTVYTEPATGTPVSDAIAYESAYGLSVAHAAQAALASAPAITPKTLGARQQSLCVRLENNFFVAAFAAGLFPDRPGYADPGCTAAAPSPLFLKTAVAVAEIGPATIAYSPGEVFPFTEIRGPFTPALAPFPTDCYNPATNDYSCGAPLPMTDWTAARMSGQYRFFAGLGEDMIGYLFPPGNFVGDDGETAENPWAAYHTNHSGSGDRFGFHHSDDSESVGPHAGLAVTNALRQLLGQGDSGEVLPGLFVDAAGARSPSPFPAAGFGGATGVVVRQRDGSEVTLLVGWQASGWATFSATPDPGTAGTAYGYSISSAGVFVNGRPLLIDVFSGAQTLSK